MDLRLVIDLLGKSPLFGSLTEPDRATVAGRMRRIDFEPNQMIFSRGDPGREIYLVLDGRVRLSVLTPDGRELSFAHAGPGENSQALPAAASVQAVDRAHAGGDGLADVLAVHRPRSAPIDSP